MPNEETKRIQNFGKQRFERLFNNLNNNLNIEVIKEWHPFTGQHNTGISSPIIDLVIGPLAINNQFISEFNTLCGLPEIASFFSKAFRYHCINLNRYNMPIKLRDMHDLSTANFSNKNARCFLAIEIEGREDRKVVLADIVNTSAIGRFGIIVARSEKVLRIFIRLLNYLTFLQSAGKPSFKTNNVIILSKEQFQELLNRCI